MTETPPAVMDEVQINEAVQFINERVLACVVNGSLEIGGYVLERFFNNDIVLAGSRNPHKPVSYNRLCRHPDLRVSSSSLMNMVKTAAQEKFLIAGGIAVDDLKYGLKIELTRLENNEAKLALAKACIDERLTVSSLKRRIRETCAESLVHPVRPVVVVGKYLDRVERYMRKVNAPEGMTSRSILDGLDPAQKKKILDLAGGVLENMAAMTHAIRQLVTILNQGSVQPGIVQPGLPGPDDAR